MAGSVLQACRAAVAAVLLVGVGCSPSPAMRASPPDARVSRDDDGGAAPEVGPGANATPPPPSGRAADRVRVSIEAEPLHLNPDLEPDVWGRRIALDAILEPLVRVGEGGRIEPMLADRWTVDDGGQRYLFYLRDGVRWHDGKPFTSMDVAFTLDRLRSPKTHAQRAAAALSDVERVELAGRLAVRLELRRPSPRLLEALSEIAILPAHELDKGDLNHHPGNRRPVGTGPLRLDDWQRRRITLSRFGDYWGTPARAATVEIVAEPDAAKALYLARRGEIDVLGHLPPAYVPDQIETPAVTSRLEVVRARSHRVALVLWNTARPPLDDATVRRALSLAVDRRRVLDDARHGLGRPEGSVPIGALPAPGKADLTAAAALLDAAGLPRASSGVRARAGKAVRLTLLVPTGSREAEAAARQVADAVGRAGIPVDVTLLDFGLLVGRLQRGAFDAALLEWSGFDDDDVEPLVGSQGAWALGGFSSRLVDQLLAEMQGLPAGEARDRTRAQLAQAVTDAAPALFLYVADEVYLHARRLGPAVLDGDFFRLRDLGPR
jgi:peptide/nickel transport system substrate-binding protein